MAEISESRKQIKLLGYIKICGEIEAKTGLHIGGTSDSIDKGGIDSPVIKNPVTNEPYIPGSSLRGRMRSLLEKKNTLKANPSARLKEIARGIWMEVYPDKEYTNSTQLAKNSEVCRMFGDSSCKEAVPSVLIVRDALYTDTTKKNYMQGKLPVTEAKLEIAVDRITSHALPRTIERVPAEARFEFEIIYKVQTYDNGKFISKNSNPEEKSDEALQKDILNILGAMQDIQEYEGLGGNTSRGSGRVRFYFHTLEIQRFNHIDSDATKKLTVKGGDSKTYTLTNEEMLKKICTLPFTLVPIAVATDVLEPPLV